jgi:hypothetical protein
MNYLLENKKYQNVIQVFKNYIKIKKELKEKETGSTLKANQLTFGNWKLVCETLLLMVIKHIK